MAGELSQPDGSIGGAWQPFTFGGAAALARSRPGRVALVGALIAGLMAAACARTFCVTWMPAIENAIKALPSEIRIQGGRLDWPTNIVVRLSEGAFLGIAVNTTDSAALPESDVTIELTPDGFRATSVLGSTFVPYPPQLSIRLEPVGLAAGWFAWKPHIVAYVFVAVFAAVWLTWLAIGLVLAPVLRLYVAVLRRAARWTDCMRLAVVCCMPGEIVMATGIFLYGTRKVSPAELLVIMVLHVILVAAYLLVTPLWFPARQIDNGGMRDKSRISSGENPFSSSPPEDAE
ncbi:MAG: hypothetical protein N3G20_01360 [Verrucomicrobiae bacterium]|nr:hypothetical protein [Verrucomicrobiae bacterium]